jgi:hypothetical protein
MGRWTRSLAVVAVATAAVVFVAGCSQGFAREGTEAPPSGAAPLTDDGGKVTIEVKWLGIDGDQLRFQVAMNTHSVDLDAYDLGELTVLRDDEGNEHRPVLWESAPGGHHRRGTLAFDGMDSLEGGETTTLEMTIRDIAGVPERVLTWHLR